MKDVKNIFSTSLVKEYTLTIDKAVHLDWNRKESYVYRS